MICQAACVDVGRGICIHDQPAWVHERDGHVLPPCSCQLSTGLSLSLISVCIVSNLSRKLYTPLLSFSFSVFVSFLSLSLSPNRKATDFNGLTFVMSKPTLSRMILFRGCKSLVGGGAVLGVVGL